MFDEALLQAAAEAIDNRTSELDGVRTSASPGQPTADVLEIIFG
jgi:hypothetical protein